MSNLRTLRFLRPVINFQKWKLVFEGILLAFLKLEFDYFHNHRPDILTYSPKSEPQILSGGRRLRSGAAAPGAFPGKMRAGTGMSRQAVVVSGGWAGARGRCPRQPERR